MVHEIPTTPLAFAGIIVSDHSILAVTLVGINTNHLKHRAIMHTKSRSICLTTQDITPADIGNYKLSLLQTIENYKNRARDKLIPELLSNSGDPMTTTFSLNSTKQEELELQVEVCVLISPPLSYK